MPTETSTHEVPMRSLIEFIERYAIDPQIYVVARGEDGRKRFELFWDREATGAAWRLRRRGCEQWTRFSGGDLVAGLQQRGVSLQGVERQLRTVALTQVVFAETLAAEARQVFGASEVDSAVRDHERFLEDLQRVVVQLTRQELKMVDGGGEQSGQRVGHLTLVQPRRTG